ncbi:hypothetical protein [Fluviicola taffensis]|uniref:Uncharacterized protein n=1 Tax=Fluviicola taffensis (strain DSM 16823 / NCIMB 13979 / RW262) TaxID=755732 RepID=F2IG14_FLUTR|nr:hypothetical protein [Fluviicola taffensis]AEA43635.1 hypothetical protein Fluta_1643 [Fluviicola taffensis DSM 16823]
MKLGVLFIGTLFIFLLSTCTKFGKNVYVDGRVYNPITGEGIPNIPIRLYRSKLDSKDPLGTDSKTLQTTTTDANGYYKMEHLSTPFNHVWIRLNNLDYYPIGWVGFGHTGSELVKKGKRNHLDYEMVPYGNYKIVVNNINCQGANDTIIIRRTNQVGSFLAIDWVLTGCGGYNSSFSQAPMGTVYTHYTVIRNGVSNEYDVNFEILPNQDNIQTINY